MHADDLRRTPGLGGQPGDGDGGGVGGQHGGRGQDAVQGAEDLRFQFEALGSRLDGEVGGFEAVAIRDAIQDGGDTGQDDFDFGLGQLSLGNLAAQVGANLGEGPVQQALFHIAKQHAESRAGKNMGDTGTHGPRAHHANRLNAGHR